MCLSLGIPVWCESLAAIVLWSIYKASLKTQRIPSIHPQNQHAWIASVCIYVLKTCRLYAYLWVQGGYIPNVRITVFWENCSELLAAVGRHAAHLSFLEENREHLQHLHLHVAALFIRLSSLKNQVSGCWQYLPLWNQHEPSQRQLCASVYNEISKLHLRKKKSCAGGNKTRWLCWVRRCACRCHSMMPFTFSVCMFTVSCILSQINSLCTAPVSYPGSVCVFLFDIIQSV